MAPSRLLASSLGTYILIGAGVAGLSLPYLILQRRSNEPPPLVVTPAPPTPAPTKPSTKRRAIYACGYGLHGALGIGTEEDRFIPTRLHVELAHRHPRLERLERVVASNNVSAAITTSNSLLLWGFGPAMFYDTPQNNAFTNQTTPRLVEAVQGRGLRPEALALSENGGAFVFSTNDEKTTTKTQDREENSPKPSTTTKVMLYGKNWTCQNGHPLTESVAPNVVSHPNNRPIVAVAKSKTTTIFVDGDGDVFMIGGWPGSSSSSSSSHYRERTIATAPPSSDTPPHVPKKITALRDIVTVTAGRDCYFALDSEETLFAFGSNQFGTLGLGRNGSGGVGGEGFVSEPRRVTGLLGKRVVAIYCTEYTAMALTAEGEVYMAGLNRDGQCGQNSGREDVFTFSRVEGLPGRVVRGAVGGHHAAVVLASGEVYMWGSGRNGQIPNARANDPDSIASVVKNYSSPVLVSLLGNQNRKRIIDVALGTDHTLFLVEEEEDGEVEK